MTDLSSSGREGDENVARENEGVAEKELNGAESDVEKAKASKSSIINVYKRKNKENKMKQVQVVPEKKAEESDLSKQRDGGKKEEKKNKTELKVKDMSDFSKQRDGGKKEDKKKKAGLKANVSEKKTQRNEVSKVRVDSKEEDHERKDIGLKECSDRNNERKDIGLKECSDRNKKRKENKLKEDDSKGKRIKTELKEAHLEGNVQRESVSKIIRKDNAKDEKSKKEKVKLENESRNCQIRDRKKKKQVNAEDDGRKGQIQDVKKKQKMVELENDLDDKENGTSEISLYKFPMKRVNRIIKNEDFNGRVSQEAVFLINKASEKFLELFTKEAYASAFLDHKTFISYNHLSSVVARRKRFDFLADFVPETVKAEDALTEMDKVET